ncbi:hypothetical protein cce_4392 [Crocosphaera subtropica ATCC 51142]|uniref:Uncharacterized protein n=1 Tax=Crocosphaera subtropica (strain ATCC 51142 / BH68) TaxID=43989 RepID=B1WTM5_CROS5|nr:hypothetical protein cce_4392 [Crocosphaera subtropica ATCC 51142]
MLNFLSNFNQSQSVLKLKLLKEVLAFENEDGTGGKNKVAQSKTNGFMP